SAHAPRASVPPSDGLMAWHFRAIASTAQEAVTTEEAGRICGARRQLLSQKAERIDDHRTHLHRQVVIGPDAWSALADRRLTLDLGPIEFCPADFCLSGEDFCPARAKPNEIGRVRTGRAAEVSSTSVLMEP